MYGISKDLTVNENLQFDAGIIPNVTLEKVSYEPSSTKDENSKKVLAFYFKGSKGETFRHLEWPVDEGREDTEKKLINMSKRIKHILSKFVPEEKIVVTNVTTFEEYCNQIISILGTANVGVPVAIKLVYNNKGNLTFTPYVPFISKDASQLKVSGSEIVVRPTPSNVTDTTTSVTDQF